MEILENIAEYYDELYPIAKSQREFYAKIAEPFKNPVKFLRIGCGTGAFEHLLAQEGADVTGTETIDSLLESANRRRRTQLMSIRFFNMTNLELSRYLGKGFYNVVSILDGRIMFTSDPVLLEKLFFDCHALLSDGGRFVVSLPDFDFFSGEEFSLPTRKSIRASLSSAVRKNKDSYFFEQLLENGNGKIVTVTRDAKICVPNRAAFVALSKKAEFSAVEFKKGFDDQTDGELVAIFSK